MPTFEEMGIQTEPKNYTMRDFIEKDECPPNTAEPLSDELKRYLLENCFPIAYEVNYNKSAKRMRTAHCKYIRLVFNGTVYLACTYDALHIDVAKICDMRSTLNVADVLDELKVIPIGKSRLTHMKLNQYNILMNY